MAKANPTKKKTPSSKSTKTVSKKKVAVKKASTTKKVAKKTTKKSTAKVAKTTSASSSKKVLIAYYSRTGHSQKIADYLAKEIKADVEIISDLTSRKGFFPLIKACRDAIKSNDTVIGSLGYDPSKYKQIVLVAPIWAGRIPPALRTYVTGFNKKFTSVVSICSAGGDDPSLYFKQLDSLLGEKLHTKIIISSKDYHSGLESLMKEIAKGLK